MCVDCANPDLQYRVGSQCAYHALVTGNDSSPQRQALAMMINPGAFTKAADSQAYYVLCGIASRGRKFGPWEEREIIAAYEAADRVAVLVGWDL